MTMPVAPGPFTGRTVPDVARALRNGRTDPVELLEHTLAAIHAAQPVLNAFVTVDDDGARRAARLRRDELARGTDLGPLHGVPVAVKDIIDTGGLVTTMGSRHFAGHLPADDAAVVASLRRHGAVIVGKTTTHQFAYGPTGDCAANGPCANPHDPSRMAGGSSAGSAAAVAAGLVPLAVGTDTGGSVRIPAALCGVVGIRPSSGRVPGSGVFPLSWSLDTVGPLADNVPDAVLGWSVLASAAHLLTVPAPDTLHIGLPDDPWFDRVDATVGSTVDAVAALLSRHGARVRRVPVPDAAQLREVYRVVQSAEAYAVHRERLATAPDLYDPEVRDRLRAAGEVPAWEYALALRRLTALRADAAGWFTGLDALLLPTVPVLAPLLGARDGDAGGGWTSARDALLAFCAPWGVLGVPSMSLPVPGAGPLPVGVQLVGPPDGEIGLFAVALTVEDLLRPR